MSSTEGLGDKIKNLREDVNKHAALGAIKDMLDRNGIDLDEIGSIERIKMYQAAAKDADGEFQVKDLIGFQINPKWETGPAWPVVQQAKPTTIKSGDRKNRAPLKGWETAVILPDPQIGYRMYENGELDPYHEEAAMDVAIQIIEYLDHEVGVEQVVNLGDFLDLPQQGKYDQEPMFAHTTQLAVDAAIDGFGPHSLLALIDHPLTALGMDPLIKSAGRNAIEIGILRRRTPSSGLVGLRAEIDRVTREPLDHHASRPVRRITASDWDSARKLVDQLILSFAAFQYVSRSETVSLSSLPGSHREVLLALTARADGREALWSAEGGETLLALFESVGDLLCELGGSGVRLAVTKADLEFLFRHLEQIGRAHV